MKIFLDANVIIDFLDSRRRHHQDAKKLFLRVFSDGIEIITSEDILTTVYYVCKKNISRRKLFDFFKVLSEEFNIVGFGKNSVKKAIKLCQKDRKLDFEDVLQAVCAKSNKCNLVVSNDKNFPNMGISVKAIKGFLEKR